MNIIELNDKAKPTREDINALQAKISELPQFDDVVTNHYFANGMYCRQTSIPANVLVVGKIHRHEHFFIITKGCLNVWSEDGEMKTMLVGDVFVSKPNSKRVVYSLEESTAITIHRTDKTDLDEIEKEIIIEEENFVALFDSNNHTKNRLEK